MNRRIGQRGRRGDPLRPQATARLLLPHLLLPRLLLPRLLLPLENGVGLLELFGGEGIVVIRSESLGISNVIHIFSLLDHTVEYLILPHKFSKILPGNFCRREEVLPSLPMGLPHWRLHVHDTALQLRFVLRGIPKGILKCPTGTEAIDVHVFFLAKTVRPSDSLLFPHRCPLVVEDYYSVGSWEIQAQSSGLC